MNMYNANDLWLKFKYERLFTKSESPEEQCFGNRKLEVTTKVES